MGEKRRSKKRAQKEEEEEDDDDQVDYGRAADMFAGRSDDEESASDKEAGDNNDNNSEESSSGGDSSSDDDDVEEEEEDVTAVFKGVDLPDDEDEDDEEEMGSDEEAESGDDEKDAPVKNWNKQTGDEHCTFDLKNLLSVNTHPIAAKSLYSSKKKDKAGNDALTIPLDPGHGIDVDESFLLAKASEDCTQLIAGLWQLPTDRSDAGPLVHLPAHDEIKLPRALVSESLASTNPVYDLYHTLFLLY
jgi:hypothetical protein